MLHNKIYQYFGREIINTFFLFLIGLSLITWTVKAVNFLDLIVENGYSVSTYFAYSILNIFGVVIKFIPLAFMIALIFFIVKHLQENEFIILWSIGLEKLKIIKFVFLISIFLLIFNLLLSIFISPLALNKSRQLLSYNNFNSLLPTLRTNQFTDSFKGFTFLIEKKFNNEVQNIFIHDQGNNLKSLSSDNSKEKNTTIIASKGIAKDKNLILFDGKIISSKKNSGETDVIKFDQLNINLTSFENNTIKTAKVQETSTFKLLTFVINDTFDNKVINKDTKKEIIPVLNRRIIYPFYLPVIALICCFLFVKNKKKFFLNKYSIFIYCLFVIIFAELIIRFTGVSKNLAILFISAPFILMPVIYLLLKKSLLNELKS